MTLLKKILAVVLYLGMAVIAYTGARIGGFFGFLIVALIPLGFFTHILMENAKHEKALKERTARAEREAELLNAIRQQQGQERKEHDGRHEILWQAPPAPQPAQRVCLTMKLRDEAEAEAARAAAERKAEATRLAAELKAKL